MLYILNRISHSRSYIIELIKYVAKNDKMLGKDSHFIVFPQFVIKFNITRAFMFDLFFSAARTVDPYQPQECMVCSEAPACVMFQPCQHVIVCVECCVKVKRCLQCQMPVTAKISPGKLAKNQTRS